MKKLYQIQNGNITVYVEWKGKEFKFMGFTVDNDPESYYVIYKSSYDPLPNDKIVVEMGKYLFNLYKTEADNQLQKYIENNINDYTFYGEYQNNSFPFWSNVINTAGTMPKSDTNYEVDLTDIMDGVVRLSTNGMYCKYNFIERMSIGFDSHYSRTEPICSAMEIFYRGNVLNELLALEQYKRGVGVPAYNEIVKLKEFLQEKKSVKIVMKSGEIYDLKKDNITVRDILNHYYNDGKLCFNLNNSYYLKPNMRYVQPLSELDYLQYGKHKHYISEKNLSIYY